MDDVLDYKSDWKISSDDDTYIKDSEKFKSIDEYMQGRKVVKGVRKKKVDLTTSFRYTRFKVTISRFIIQNNLRFSPISIILNMC